VDKAAIKAMLVNRVGDFGLALGISNKALCVELLRFFFLIAFIGPSRSQSAVGLSPQVGL
jgi:NADH:ubiquinone oxidoreductase subunit 5 (subunit L)/multisubunit Na+/H+ antiporter MnhA subunit